MLLTRTLRMFFFFLIPHKSLIQLKSFPAPHHGRTTIAGKSGNPAQKSATFLYGILNRVIIIYLNAETEKAGKRIKKILF